MIKGMSVELISGDRRRDRRYEVELQSVFSYANQRGDRRVSCGVTVELSRGGARFHALEPPPVGVEAEIRIAWPIKLQETIPLELCLCGMILSSGERGTVLAISGYEFRSCGAWSFSAPPEHDRVSQVA